MCVDILFKNHQLAPLSTLIILQDEIGYCVMKMSQRLFVLLLVPLNWCHKVQHFRLPAQPPSLSLQLLMSWSQAAVKPPMTTAFFGKRIHSPQPDLGCFTRSLIPSFSSPSHSIWVNVNPKLSEAFQATLADKKNLCILVDGGLVCETR